MKQSALLAVASCLLVSCGDSEDDYDDDYYDNDGNKIRVIDNRHLLGNYDLQKYYNKHTDIEAFYVVKVGNNAIGDGGVFGWSIDEITVAPPNEVYVYINQGFGPKATGAYKLDTNSGEITGPLADPNDHPWIDVWEFFTDYL